MHPGGRRGACGRVAGTAGRRGASRALGARPLGPMAPCSPACAADPSPGPARRCAPFPPTPMVRFLLDRQDIARAGEPTLGGIDGVAQVIAQFEGAALPMEQWEREVLPARVPDFRPAMLDELIAAGEVLWAASTVGEAHPISFFPTDSPLAPLPVDAQAGGGGGLRGRAGGVGGSFAGRHRAPRAGRPRAAHVPCFDGWRRAARRAVARTGREVAEALQRLVWKGEATSDGLGFPRAGGLAAAASASAAGGQTPPPSRRRASSRRGRSLRSEARRASVRPWWAARLRRPPSTPLSPGAGRPWRRVARAPRCKRWLWWSRCSTATAS